MGCPGLGSPRLTHRDRRNTGSCPGGGDRTQHTAAFFPREGAPNVSWIRHVPSSAVPQPPGRPCTVLWSLALGCAGHLDSVVWGSRASLRRWLSPAGPRWHHQPPRSRLQTGRGAALGCARRLQGQQIGGGHGPRGRCLWLCLCCHRLVCSRGRKAGGTGGPGRRARGSVCAVTSRRPERRPTSGVMNAPAEGKLGVLREPGRRFARKEP